MYSIFYQKKAESDGYARSDTFQLYSDKSVSIFLFMHQDQHIFLQKQLHSNQCREQKTKMVC